MFDPRQIGVVRGESYDENMPRLRRADWPGQFERHGRLGSLGPLSRLPGQAGAPKLVLCAEESGVMPKVIDAFFLFLNAAARQHCAVGKL